jgi:hypothetical protein
MEIISASMITAAVMEPFIKRVDSTDKRKYETAWIRVPFICRGLLIVSI